MKTSKRIQSENLKRLMEHHQVSQLELSRRAGVGQATISRILKEESAAAIDTLDSIGAVFGVSAWQILVPELDPSNHPVIREVSDKEREFYERIKQAAKQLAGLQ